MALDYSILSLRPSTAGANFMAGKTAQTNINATNAQTQRQNRLLEMQEAEVDRLNKERQRREIKRDFALNYQSNIKPFLDQGDAQGAQRALQDRVQSLSDDPERQQLWQDSLDMFNENPEIARRRFDQAVNQAEFEKLIPSAPEGTRVTAILNGKEVPAIETKEGFLKDPTTGKRMPTAIKKEKVSGRGGSKYFSPRDVTVTDEDGNKRTVPMSFDHRENKWTIADVDGLKEGETITVPKFDPGVVENVAKSKKTGEHKAKREFNMAGINSLIDKSKNVLMGVETGETPTESGIGAVADATARFFGITLDGASEAAMMESLGGALVSKMPRMEGPQSDRDVELYKQMAAKVGDRNIPTQERLQALEVVRTIWGKYEHLQGFEGEGDAPPNAIKHLRHNNTPEMRKAFKEKYGYLPKGL